MKLNEKFFSNRELKNFLKEPTKYASAKCLSYVDFTYDSKFIRDHIAIKHENQYVLFSKDKSNNALLFSTDYLCHFDSVYEYYIDGDILIISWGAYQAVLELYEDFNFDIKLKKRDEIGERLYKIISLEGSASRVSDESFGFKIHNEFKGKSMRLRDLTTRDDERVIKIDDIKDYVLKEYFNNQDIHVDVWKNTILMKCFDRNPAFVLHKEYFSDDDFTFNELDYSGIPWWMSKCEESKLTECLSTWKESNMLCNKDVENIEKVKSLLHNDIFDDVIKNKEKNYNIEVLKTIISVYGLRLNLTDIRYSKNIYSTLYANLKMEKYFTKEKIRAFRKDEKNHANCKCISDEFTDSNHEHYTRRTYENRYALIKFDAQKKVLSIFMTSQYDWINFSEYKNILAYSIVDNLFSIRYRNKTSVFTLIGNSFND